MIMDINKLQHVLRPFLLPFGKAYAGIMRLRRNNYEQGRKQTYRPEALCISVGNIGWGGSGKTPMTAYLARRCPQKNRSAVVLTRGYRARPPHLPFVVQPDANVREAGDEPLMLAVAEPDLKVVVDPVRRRSGAFAQERFSPDVVILDDGFQHLAVERDIDLVLLRPEDLTTEWNRVIPSGSWREDISALQRASAFCIKTDAAHEPDAEFEARILSRLEPFHVPIFLFSLEPRGIVCYAQGKREPVEIGRDAPYIFVSSIARPAAAEQTATRFLGRRPEIAFSFGDHHRFTRKDAVMLQRAAQAANVEHIVCTAKDAVKLGRFFESGLYVLEVDMLFGRYYLCDRAFPEWLEVHFNTHDMKNR